MSALSDAACALDVGRPASAQAIAEAALSKADSDLEREALLHLRNYARWLAGDWSDMPGIIEGFRAARILSTTRNTEGPTMRAVVATAPGRLALLDVPEPEPLPGMVKIRVEAFGLNRTEKFLANGGWPVTQLSPIAPLVNGVECAGTVVAYGSQLGGEQLAEGTRVLACASSLGRGIDGTHAEYVVVPRWGVVAIPEAAKEMSWRELAALPLSYGTASGSLRAMDTAPGDTVLVRGGTSALGLSAISLAKHTLGCTVLATSRRPDTEAQLRAAGADHTFIEPEVRSKVRSLFPEGIDRALECVGEATLKDTMHCVRRGGVMCQMGALSRAEHFRLRLLGEVPSAVKVTCYESDTLVGAELAPVLGELVHAVASGDLELALDAREFFLDDYLEALNYLDAPDRRGKVVVSVR